MDPQTLQVFSYIAAVVGLGQLIYGVMLTRSTDPAKQFISCVMQAGGIGFLICAAICYFASGYDWALTAGLGSFAVVSVIGSVVGLKTIKARGLGK